MDQDQISRCRRFSRSVAVETGVLNDSFLGRGRPLGAARVLNAIGIGYKNVSDIRRYLDLDTGLLSRLLRSLEKENLIEVHPDPSDGRGRIARLTSQGKAEFDEYEKLSDERAINILTRHKNAAHLLEAMDIITTVFSQDRIIIQEVDYTDDDAMYCLNQFASELNKRLNTGFDLVNSGDPELSNMKHPHGAFIIATLDDQPIGCIGVKGTGSEVAEIKRMWVAPSARGLGLGGRLMNCAEIAAEKLSINTLRLDTNTALIEAVRLYKREGWQEIDRFNDDPYPNIFFEKRI